MKSSGKASTNPKLKKWNSAYQDADISSATAARVLTDNAYLLPQATPAVTALDLACGRAGNAIFLAKTGITVDAVDLSPIVLQQLEDFVQKEALPINCIQRDIEQNGLDPQKKYDVIVVSYFLNRELFPQIVNALKPGGLLFYQTWSQLSSDNAKGPSNPAFRLAQGELLSLCATLRIIHYREDGLQGNLQKGIRNEALLLAQRV